MDGLDKGDEKGSMGALAPILHGIIDSYWPGRVTRDADGAITGFKDCDFLGGLQGALREEKQGVRPSGAIQNLVTSQMAEVIRKWKERRPFEEVEPLIRNGAMKINAASSLEPLVPRTSSN